MHASRTEKTWIVCALAVMAFGLANRRAAGNDENNGKDATSANALQLVDTGRKIFRFDTFGDQTFWGDAPKLHLAIEGSTHGGNGPGLSPRAALAAGLKVDIDALPNDLIHQIQSGGVNLDDPGVTLTLLKLNTVVGITAFFNSGGTLNSVGIQCALCHSTVDASMPALCAGQIQPNPRTGCIGHRLDGWANRDLNVGAIVALAPDLTPFANLLNVSQAIELRKSRISALNPISDGEGNTACCDRTRVTGWPCVVLEPWHAEKQHAREPGDLGSASLASGARPIREGENPQCGYARF
jgi:hypothetical protein